MTMLLLLSDNGATASFRSVLLLELGGTGALTTPTGTLSFTNSSDTVAASGSTTIVGSLAKTSLNDTLAASGATSNSGGFRSLLLLELGGASTIIGVIGSLAVTLANDTLEGSGYNDELDYTNLNDTLAGSGTTTIRGVVAKTNSNDTISANGNSGVVAGFRSAILIELGGISSSNDSFGILAVTNSNDTLVGVGTVPVVVNTIHSRRNRPGRGPYSLGEFFTRSIYAVSRDLPGVLSVINSNDTLATSGWAGTISGTASVTLFGDTIVAVGNNGVTGSLSVTLANDTLNSGGASAVSGSLAYTNNNDTMVGYVIVGNPPEVTARLPMTGVGS